MDKVTQNFNQKDFTTKYLLYGMVNGHVFLTHAPM